MLFDMLQELMAMPVLQPSTVQCGFTVKKSLHGTNEMKDVHNVSAWCIVMQRAACQQCVNTE
jgi:hypothetical protein